jgi:aminoglycoside phosphotransferase (APT) family kinase protein
MVEMDVSKIDSSEHRRALRQVSGAERDMDRTAAALARWLEGRVGDKVEVHNLRRPTGAGIANETLMFEASFDGAKGRETRGLVARLKPTAAQLFPEPDFEGLVRLLHVLRGEGLVKVPEAMTLEDDSSILGAPFFIMEMIKGRTPVTQPPYNKVGWLADATVAQRNTVWRTAISGMASIHRVPGELVSFLGWPQHGETGEDQQLGYWFHYAEWTGIAMPPEVVELGQWVRHNRPHIPGTYLSWGDARIGNMMFGDDFSLAAVLDWDQMSLADPRHDLAWWLFFDEFNSGYHGIPRLEGLGDREETIALWEEASGHQAGDLRWHEAFMAYKIALITMKTLVASGQSYDAAAALATDFVRRGRVALDR